MRMAARAGAEPAGGGRTVISARLGTLREDPRSRAEFLGLAGVSG
jgi:hypothetical protein